MSFFKSIGKAFSGIGKGVSKAFKGIGKFSPLLSLIPGVGPWAGLAGLLGKGGKIGLADLLGAGAGFLGQGATLGKLIPGLKGGLGGMKIDQLLPLLAGGMAGSTGAGDNSLSAIMSKYKSLMPLMTGAMGPDAGRAMLDQMLLKGAQTDIGASDDEAVRNFASARVAQTTPHLANVDTKRFAAGWEGGMDTERGVERGVIQSGANRDIAGFSAGLAASRPERAMGLLSGASGAYGGLGEQARRIAQLMPGFSGMIGGAAALDEAARAKKTARDKGWMDLVYGIGDMLKPRTGPTQPLGGQVKPSGWVTPDDFEEIWKTPYRPSGSYPTSPMPRYAGA